VDLLPLGFLILIVVMSGGIAVLADDLGRRLGKKRLHVKGLRPKRVAQIGTALAGVLVSLGTIAVVAIASSGVRQWIREGSAAIRQVSVVRKELAENERQRDVLLKQNRQLEQQIRQGTGQLSLLRTQIGQLKPQIALLHRQMGEARKRIASLNQERNRAKQELAADQEQLRSLTTQLSTVRVALQIAKESERKAIQSKNAAVAEKATTDQQNQELLMQQEKLSQQVEELKADQKRVEAARDKAQSDVAEAKARLSSTQVDLAKAQNDLEQANRDLAAAEMNGQFYKGISLLSRSAPIMYRSGEEVVRMAVEPGSSLEKAHLAVTSLVRAARNAAREAGAKSNGQYPEAGIFWHRDDVTQRTISPEEYESEVAMSIARASQPMVLVASSTLNAFKGEPVSLEVTLLPNPLVYHRNDIIAEKQIDGRKDPTSIFKEISDLRTRVRARAVQDRMLPKAGSDVPNGAEIWTLVSQVKASDRQVRVRALAEDDTRAGDPLRLRFAVR